MVEAARAASRGRVGVHVTASTRSVSAETVQLATIAAANQLHAACAPAVLHAGDEPHARPPRTTNGATHASTPAGGDAGAGRAIAAAHDAQTGSAGRPHPGHASGNTAANTVSSTRLNMLADAYDSTRLGVDSRPRQNSLRVAGEGSERTGGRGGGRRRAR